METSVQLPRASLNLGPTLFWRLFEDFDVLHVLLDMPGNCRDMPEVLVRLEASARNLITYVATQS